MPEPEPTSRTPMSQWLRPGNVAFVFGGAVGLAAIGCQLRSSCPRGVNGLAIASAVVSMMFGVYDRTVSEKLTWTSLGGAVREWSSGELRAITLDIEMAYRIAIPDRTRGTLRDIRTLGLELWILRRIGTIEPYEIGLPPTFNNHPHNPDLWEVVPFWHNVPTSIALYVIICSRIPPDTDSIWLICLVCTCWATSWLVTAGDVHFLVVLFTILRHFGRLICCLPFTTTIRRISRDACHSATTSIRNAQLSPTVAGLRLGLAAVPATCLVILFVKALVLFNRIGVEIVVNNTESKVLAWVGLVGIWSTWFKALVLFNRIQLDTEVIATIRAGAIASLCTAPAASGFFIVAIAWIGHFTQEVISLARAPSPGLPLPGSGTQQSAPVTANPSTSHAVPGPSAAVTPPPPKSQSSLKAGSSHAERSAPLRLIELEPDGSIPLQVIRVLSTPESPGPPVDQSIAQYVA